MDDGKHSFGTVFKWENTFIASKTLRIDENICRYDSLRSIVVLTQLSGRCFTGGEIKTIEKAKKSKCIMLCNSNMFCICFGQTRKTRTSQEGLTI